jgi:hypothetical protein
MMHGLYKLLKAIERPYLQRSSCPSFAIVATQLRVSTLDQNELSFDIHHLAPRKTHDSHSRQSAQELGHGTAT